MTAPTIDWLPCLAEVSASAARTAGFWTGVLLSIVALLAVATFGLVAIIMAITRRTTGWIVAAVLAGSITLLFVGLNVKTFITGFRQGFERSHHLGGPSETVTGSAIAFTIDKPGGWLLKRKQAAYEVIVSNNLDFVGVIAEAPDLGSPAPLAQVARKRIVTVGSDVTISNNETVMIDGRQWIAFTVRCKVALIPFGYQYYVYSGSEGSYQIMGWTFQNLFDRDLPVLRQTMQSFHFPGQVQAPALK